MIFWGNIKSTCKLSFIFPWNLSTLFVSFPWATIPILWRFYIFCYILKKCIAFFIIIYAIWWTLNIIKWFWTCYLQTTTTGFICFSGNGCILFQNYLNRCIIYFYFSDISYSNLTNFIIFPPITNIFQSNIFNFSISIFFYNWNWSLDI